MLLLREQRPEGVPQKLSVSYPYISVDNEAGQENLSRRTTRNVNAPLIVANRSVTALRSAGRSHKLVTDPRLGVGQTHLAPKRIKAACARQEQAA